MNNECPSGIPCLGQPQQLSGQLSVPVGSLMFCFPWKLNEAKKKISVIWLQSTDMTHIISESERGLPYYHISTSTYQFRCSLFSQCSSVFNKSMIFFLNKAELTTYQCRLPPYHCHIIVIVWRTMRSLIGEHIFTLLISPSYWHLICWELDKNQISIILCIVYYIITESSWWVPV